jgi:hypothetical protein
MISHWILVVPQVLSLFSGIIAFVIQIVLSTDVIGFHIESQEFQETQAFGLAAPFSLITLLGFMKNHEKFVALKGLLVFH